MFKYELGQSINIKASGEQGIIEGRAEYLEESNSYFIHYCAADGRAVSKWFNERQLSIANQVPANCFVYAAKPEQCITTPADPLMQSIRTKELTVKNIVHILNAILFSAEEVSKEIGKEISPQQLSRILKVLESLTRRE